MQRLHTRNLCLSFFLFFFNILVKTFPGNSEVCCGLKCCTKVLINNITKWHDYLGVQANILCDSYAFVFKISVLGDICRDSNEGRVGYSGKVLALKMPCAHTGILLWKRHLPLYRVASSLPEQLCLWK